MDVEGRLCRARGSADELTSVLYDHDEEVLLALLDNLRLNDDHVKVLLSRRDLPPLFFREMVTRERLLRSYDVKLALVRHPRAPRSTALVLLRHLYTFDLLRVATTPTAAPELRRAAEEALMNQLPSLPLGERIALARQASPRLAAALVADPREAVFSVALASPRLTEDGVLRALRDGKIAAAAVDAIARHPRWSARHEVRLAIIRSPGASLARVLAMVEQVSRRELAEITGDEAMPRERRQYLMRLVKESGTRRPVPVSMPGARTTSEASRSAGSAGASPADLAARGEPRDGDGGKRAQKAAFTI